MTSSRRLAAIMFTDIAGFTQLSSEDEKAALHLIDSQRELLQPIVKQHEGTWLKEMGDGILISFPSSTRAVQCAVKIQESVREYPKLNLRIGIHQGDIVVKGNDVFGDDVNIAARIETLAPVGGIAVSHKVQGDISGNPEFRLKYAGRPKLKGVKQKVEIYCIISHGLPSTLSGGIKGILERSKYSWVSIASLLTLVLAGWYFLLNETDQTERIAVLPIRNLSGDSTQEYLSDGMTRDLIKELSSYKPLQIIQPLSSMHYKDSIPPFSTIAKELNADHLIDG
jgi:class 3 adenylate cyclase